MKTLGPHNGFLPVTVYNSNERLTDWLAAAGNGDEAAAEAIYRRFAPAVFRLAAGLLNDADDADEVTQDTFVYALRNLRRYDPSKSAFQTWLFTIAISRYRNKRRRKWLASIPLLWFAREESAEAHKHAPARPLEDWLAARGVRRELWAEVQSLSPKLREAIVLRFVGAMGYAQIGEAAGCGAKAAESRVRAAIAALRRRLIVEGNAGREWLEALESSQQ